MSHELTSPILVCYNCINSDCIILNQLFANWKHIEFLDAGSCFTNAPAHQHVQF